MVFHVDRTLGVAADPRAGSLASPPILMAGGFSPAPWLWRRGFLLPVSCPLFSTVRPSGIEITLFAARQKPAPLEELPVIKIGGPDRGPFATKFLPPLPSRGEGATLWQSRGEGPLSVGRRTHRKARDACATRGEKGRL